VPPPVRKRKRRVWKWIGIGTAIAVVALVVAGEIVIHNAGGILKGRITETLSARFHSRVEMGDLDVSVLRGLEVSGDSLRIYPTKEVMAAGVTEPLIAIRHFSFHSGILGLFFKPMRVGTVAVEGLRIDVPPRSKRSQGAQDSRQHFGKIKIVVDEIVCDDSRLVIETDKPDKDPKEFVLQHIDLRNVGPDAPLQYRARLINAIPRGEIHAIGTFGPWQTDSPGDSPVTGHYTFDHADLNTIHGIGGLLSSVGEFKGRLNRMEVEGTADVPDFSLDTADSPVPLYTRFHAVVDGTTGDTYLQPVRARLRNSEFTTSGAVIDIKGRGHKIDLDVDIPAGHLEDFLALAVKTQPPVMGAIIQTKTRLEIPPGPESVARKLRLQGGFTLRNIHFSNPKIQDKVDMLSLRASGEPEKAKPGAVDVRSQMNGSFMLRGGVLTFADLRYSLPGAKVNLEGVYSLDGQQFEFHGKVDTKATLSQMVASRWASLALKPLSWIFKKNGAGAEIPVKISGTRSEPKFGLDLFGHH
jgi:hypothetical protein